MSEDTADAEPPKPTLDNVPRDIQRRIIGPLGLKDRCSVRRCNKAMEEAVASTDFRDEQMTIQVSRTGERDYGSTVINLENHKRFTYRNSDGEIVLAWRRLFQNIKGAKLEINWVPYNDALLKNVNEFIDACFADNLRIDFLAHQSLERFGTVIARVSKEIFFIAFDSYFTKEEFLSIPRPAVFEVNNFLEDDASDDELILELLRRGHSIKENMAVPIQSAQTLMEAIKIITKSPIPQMFGIRFGLSIADEFVNLTKDDLVFDEEHWAGVKGMSSRYEYHTDEVDRAEALVVINCDTATDDEERNRGQGFFQMRTKSLVGKHFGYGQW